MTKRTLLALCAIDPILMDQLDEHFEIIRLYNEQDPEQKLNEVKDDVQAIIATMHNPVRENLIVACPNLEIIALASVGYDNVDMVCAKNRGIIVTNTPDVVTNDTADTAMGLLLSVARGYNEGDAFVRAGHWKAKARKPMGVTLQYKKLGIFGLGRIGKAIAKKALAFDMEISYCGRNKQDHVVYDYYSDLKQMASDVDFLMLACPGGEATKHIINLDILDALGNTSYLINISRGSVVDEGALVIALQNKMIAGAGLDVFENEPNVPEEMITMDNVVLFPHLGAATKETFFKIHEIVMKNLLAHQAGKAVLTPIV